MENDDSIFSRYKTGENRVTASIMAVLSSLPTKHTYSLLLKLIQDSEFELLSFINQPHTDGHSVPDAEICCSTRILIETKTSRNAVRDDQLIKHMEYLNKNADAYAKKYLLYLTPDSVKPSLIAGIANQQLVWASFNDFNQAINDLLGDNSIVISERETFLMKELQKMLLNEGLLGYQKDTVVVAARNAWSEYQELGAYIYQKDRSFQKVKYIAFYSNGEIKKDVPEIINEYPLVEFQRGIHSEAIVNSIVERALDAGIRAEGDVYNIFALSAPNDNKTRHLKTDIRNDLTADSRRGIAFTQSQRYVYINDLLKAETTSDLVKTSPMINERDREMINDE